MLERRQAYLIGKTTLQIASLEKVARSTGFTNTLSLATTEGYVSTTAPIKFFFAHFRVPDSEKLSAMAAVRASHDNDLRFSPFILIIDDCDYDVIVKYVHLELVELSENAERAAAPINPETAVRSRRLIVEVAEWQQKLSDWQGLDLSPRLQAEMRILKATLDASMDEANSAASKLHLFS
jgi:hypothetical protein